MERARFQIVLKLTSADVLAHFQATERHAACARIQRLSTEDQHAQTKQRWNKREWEGRIEQRFDRPQAARAGQHQLTRLAHEASHHILFKNRYWNDLASDFLCMFPLYSATHHYRLQHIAHHQFVNDPVRDPDVSQLQTSGHWLDFPLERAKVARTLLKQIWPPRLFKFMRIRAKYNALPQELKNIIDYAVQAASADMSWKAVDRNSKDYDEMKKAGVKFYKTPDAILRAQLAAWDKVIDKKSSENPLFKKVLDSQRAFAQRAGEWQNDYMVDFKMAYNHYFAKKKS